MCIRVCMCVYVLFLCDIWGRRSRHTSQEQITYTLLQSYKGKNKGGWGHQVLELITTMTRGFSEELGWTGCPPTLRVHMLEMWVSMWQC